MFSHFTDNPSFEAFLGANSRDCEVQHLYSLPSLRIVIIFCLDLAELQLPGTVIVDPRPVYTMSIITWKCLCVSKLYQTRCQTLRISERLSPWQAVFLPTGLVWFFMELHIQLCIYLNISRYACEWYGPMRDLSLDSADWPSMSAANALKTSYLNQHSVLLLWEIQSSSFLVPQVCIGILKYVSLYVSLCPLEHFVSEFRCVCFYCFHRSLLKATSNFMQLIINL